MAIIQSLRKIGEDPEFFNIDYFRYKHEEIESYFRDNQFDVVGISAVVSTAYAYTKYLTQLIHRVSPETIVIVGGNLAASAEILLNKCKVDFCVAGDGELIIQDLIKILYERPLNYERLKTTKGICFSDARGDFCFTGYGPRPSAEEIESPDYSILEADGSISYFIADAKTVLGVQEHQACLTGNSRPLRDGEKIATVLMTKGCVARCTFCHRWERGFRARPADRVIEHVRFLKEHYNVAFINVADENFGSDVELAGELATRLGELGMAWMVAGVRTRTVTPESLQHWKRNGCIKVYFGVESGSQTMLDVMEKNTTVEANINALKWTYEAGLGTIVQLVIGMPGETDRTIYETIDFLKTVSPYYLFWDDNHYPSDVTSINYAQALPGTPLYEYAREHGFIGETLEDEEKYLLKISDTDAYKEDHFINYTGQPLLKVLMWRYLILAELDAYFLRQRKMNVYIPLQEVLGYYIKIACVKFAQKLGVRNWFMSVAKRILPQSWLARFAKEKEGGEQKEYSFVTDSGYFNIHSGLKFAPLLLNPFTRRFVYPLLAMAVAVQHLVSSLQSVKLLMDHVMWSLLKGAPPKDLPTKSLRKIVPSVSSRHEDDSNSMLPLRAGR